LLLFFAIVKHHKNQIETEETDPVVSSLSLSQKELLKLEPPIEMINRLKHLSQKNQTLKGLKHNKLQPQFQEKQLFKLSTQDSSSEQIRTEAELKNYSLRVSRLNSGEYKDFDNPYNNT
jgi:hypothetical protein